MKYELWEAIDASGIRESALIAECDDQSRRMAADDPNMKITWAIEAGSRDEAMREYHKHMGWGPYVPFEEQSGPFREIIGRTSKNDEEGE